MDKLKYENVRKTLIDTAVEILTARETVSRRHPVESELSDWLGAIRSAVLLVDELLNEIESFHKSITFEAIFQLNNDCLEHRMDDGKYRVIAPMTTIIQSMVRGERSPYIRQDQAIAALFCIVRKLNWQINQTGK